jgi:hypothetical protein
MTLLSFKYDHKSDCAPKKTQKKTAKAPMSESNEPHKQISPEDDLGEPDLKVFFSVFSLVVYVCTHLVPCLRSSFWVIQLLVNRNLLKDL